MDTAARKQRAAATASRPGSQSFASGSQSFASGSQSFASGSRSLARTPPGAASPSTTFALARRFASARVTLDANRRGDFDAYAEILRRPETLRATRALLARTHARLVAGGVNLAADPACAALRRCLEPPKERGETNRAFEKANRRTAEPPNGDVAFPTRVVLCAYMIDAHPDVVLGAADDESNQDEDEDEATATATANATARRPRFAHEIDLRRSAAALVTALNEVVASAARLTSDDSSKAPVPVAVAASDFGTAWRRYLSDFARWKIADASALELELTRAAAALEASALRVCGTDATVAYPPESDEAATREACAADTRTLREKVASLAGDEGVARFDAALAEARVAVEAEEEAAARAATHATNEEDESSARRTDAAARSTLRASRRAATRDAIRASRAAAAAERHNRRDDASSPSRPSSDSATRASSFAEEANEAIMHELLVDPEWRLPEWRDAARDANDSSLGARVRETMERAFWDRVRDAVAAGVLADPKGSSDADVSREFQGWRAKFPAAHPRSRAARGRALARRGTSRGARGADPRAATNAG